MTIRTLPKNASAAQIVSGIQEWLDEKMRADEPVLLRSSLARSRHAALGELREEIEAWKAQP